MRTHSTTLVVLALVAMVTAQTVFTNFDEYQRKKVEYDRQKAKYDEFQSLANVPILAGYDLISKGRDAEAAPGKAELLLPEYTGIKIDFQGGETGRVVEPGNTAQNFFHSGPIPAKKSSSPSPGPIAIPVAPGQDFVIPEQSNDAPAPEAPAPEAPAPPLADAPIPAAPSAESETSVGQAIFFGRGALPAAADAPEYRGPTRVSFEGSSSAVNVVLREEALRAAAAAAAAPPAPLPAIPAAPAPLPLPQHISFTPAQTYGPPGNVGLFRR